MSRQNETAPPTGTSECPPLTSTRASSNDLASSLECSACFDSVLPPIVQCQSGHLLCSSCRPKLTQCPTCLGSLGSLHDLLMENVASSVLFPCQYASFGCRLSLKHTEVADHEELCEFRPCSCPCPGSFCMWQGALDTVMPHLINDHEFISTTVGEDVVLLATKIDLPGYVDWVMVQACYGFHFMTVLGKRINDDGHEHFFAIVQLIGTRLQAGNFVYRLQLYGHRRKLTWKATPLSIYEDTEIAFRKGDCLVFACSTAQLFAECGNLGIHVLISLS